MKETIAQPLPSKKSPQCSLAIKARSQQKTSLRSTESDSSSFCPHFRHALYRDRQKAILTFLAALATVRTAASHLQLEMAGLEDPVAFTAATLQTVLASVGKTIAAAEKAAANQEIQLNGESQSYKCSNDLPLLLHSATFDASLVREVAD